MNVKDLGLSVWIVVTASGTVIRADSKKVAEQLAVGLHEPSGVYCMEKVCVPT